MRPGGGRCRWMAMGRAASLDAMAQHQALDPVVTDGSAFGSQSRMDARHAIAPAMLAVEPPYVAQQGSVCCLARRVGPLPPSIVSGGRNIESIAENTNRIPFPQVFNGPKSHFAGSETMESVFFRISFSIRSRSFSRLSRAISAA